MQEEDHWEEAYQMNKQAVEELKKNGYALFTTCTNPSTFGTYDAAAFHQLFVKMQTIQQNHVIKKQFGNIVPEVFSYGMSVI